MVLIKTHHIHTDNLRVECENLNIFDKVYLTGTVYTARDAAHKKMFELIAENLPLPFNINDAVIYFAGPTPTPEGMAIGSCGPTTSGRMNPYTPKLMDMGLVCTIGKGERSKEVYDAIVRNKGVYLCSIGGAGALAAKCIKSCEVIAFAELGCESVKRLAVEDFPLIVCADSHGKNIFDEGKKQYNTL